VPGAARGLAAYRASVHPLHAQIDPLKAELVKLHYFAGLTTRQVAQTIGMSTVTADRYLAYAWAWLQREMSPDEDASS
jgi:DNA-directed RNA polymerase specialized sigma24 family protein